MKSCLEYTAVKNESFEVQLHCTVLHASVANYTCVRAECLHLKVVIIFGLLYCVVNPLMKDPDRSDFITKDHLVNVTKITIHLTIRARICKLVI